MLCVSLLPTGDSGQAAGDQDTQTQKKRAPILTLTIDRFIFIVTVQVCKAK